MFIIFVLSAAFPLGLYHTPPQYQLFRSRCVGNCQDVKEIWRVHLCQQLCPFERGYSTNFIKVCYFMIY